MVFILFIFFEIKLQNGYFYVKIVVGLKSFVTLAISLNRNVVYISIKRLPCNLLRLYREKLLKRKVKLRILQYVRGYLLFHIISII